MRLSRNLCCGRSGAVRRVSGSPAELRERARVHFKSDDEEIKELERRLRLIGRSLPQQGLDDTLPFLSFIQKVGLYDQFESTDSVKT